jgi:hypothetical protein
VAVRLGGAVRRGPGLHLDRRLLRVRRGERGYLTVSEIFPIEIRAEALAVFFALAQVVGAAGPAFYGVLIGNGGNRAKLAIGYLVGGGIMIIGGVVEALIGINAEGKPLEQIAPPLTEVDTAG